MKSVRGSRISRGSSRGSGVGIGLFRSFLWILALPVIAVMARQVAPGFEPALPGYVFEFPRDHGSHPAFATEWWYYTGHLRTEKGREYGFELTFFRVGTRPADSGSPAPKSLWDLRDVSLAHFAVTDVGGGRFRYHEKLNRSTPFTAGSSTGHLEVFNESWRASTMPDGRVRLLADAGSDAIELVLSSKKGPAIHGVNGVSVKAEGTGYASHYYSLTRIEVEGRVRSGEQWQKCRGSAWMDHEFGSASLREHQQGWDWFSVQLDNETELMLYQIRTRSGSSDVTSSGTFVMPDGSLIHLTRDQFTVRPTGTWTSPVSGARYPMGWEIVVKPLRLTLRLTARLRDQELRTKSSTQVTYWEGAVTASGGFAGTPVAGLGYVEMTGYERPFRPAP